MEEAAAPLDAYRPLAFAGARGAAMRMRKLQWVAAAGLVALAGVAAFVPWPRPSRPFLATRQNYDRIRVGMTRAEIEASLGPPGDHTTGPTRPTGRDHGVDGSGLVCASVAHWFTDDGWIAVEFDAKGRVRGWSWRGTKRAEQSPLDNLLWRAKRQWRRWFP
jgi:hypothetical protein